MRDGNKFAESVFVLQAQVVEAEVLWGTATRDLLEPVHDAETELAVALGELIQFEYSGPTAASKERRHVIRQRFFGNRDGTDQIGTMLNSGLTRIESVAREHLANLTLPSRCDLRRALGDRRTEWTSGEYGRSPCDC